MLDVSIVIINWNRKDLVRRCVASVLGESGVSLEVILVDNGSTDGSREMLASEFPEVRCIENASNRGFTVAANQGIAESRGRYVLVLNSDAEGTDGAVARMVRFVDAHPDVGALGCRLLNSDGSLQPSCYADMGVGKALAIASGLYDIMPFDLMGKLNPDGFVRRLFDLPDHDRPLFPDWFRGACMMFRRDALTQVGTFDEGFFLYCEEIDLFYRMRAEGWRIAYTPTASFFHHGRADVSMSDVRMVLTFWRSFLRLYEKHHKPHRLAALRVAMFAGTCIRVLGSLTDMAVGVDGAAADLRACGAILAEVLD